MNIYQTNRNWSDQFLPQIKRIVGCHLLETSPDPLDWHQATDLLMLDARDMRIAAGVRRPGYAAKYPHQFTMRSCVASGAETELSKIVNGQGDWLFYGHANAAQTAMTAATDAESLQIAATASGHAKPHSVSTGTGWSAIAG